MYQDSELTHCFQRVRKRQKNKRASKSFCSSYIISLILMIFLFLPVSFLKAEMKIYSKKEIKDYVTSLLVFEKESAILFIITEEIDKNKAIKEWKIGRGFTKSGNYYAVVRVEDLFVVRVITEEEAKKYGFKEYDILHLESITHYIDKKPELPKVVDPLPSPPPVVAEVKKSYPHQYSKLEIKTWLVSILAFKATSPVIYLVLKEIDNDLTINQWKIGGGMSKTGQIFIMTRQKNTFMVEEVTADEAEKQGFEEYAILRNNSSQENVNQEVAEKSVAKLPQTEVKKAETDPLVPALSKHEETPKQEMGIKFGLSFAYFKGTDVSNVQSIPGIAMVFYKDMFIFHQALRLEIIYSQKGAQNTVNDQVSKITLDYLEIPLLAKLSVSKEISTFAGPSMGYNLGCRQNVPTAPDCTNAIRSIEFGLVFGIHYTFKQNFNIDFRHNYGLTDVSRNKSSNSSTLFMFGYSF